MTNLDPREIIAREPMHPRQVLAIAVATALNALDGFDVLSISFASPGIARDWGVDRAALGVVLSMELIGMAIGALVLGALADKAGRRPTILICLVAMALGMFAASQAHEVYFLSAVRLFTGLGIGGMLAATNAIVAECSNAKRRNLSVAIMAGGYPMGAIVGGTIASALIGATGRWQIVFEFGAVATACFIPLVLLLVPETVAFLLHKRPPDALARVNQTMVRQGRPPLPCLPEMELRAKARFMDLFAPGMAATTTILTVAYFTHIMTFYFLVKWIPKIVSDLGFDPSAAGGVLVWANVGGASGSLAISLLSIRFRVRSLVICAMLMASLAVAAFGQNLSGLGEISLVAAIGGFFTNGATAGLYALFAQSFPASHRAGGTGFIIGVGRGGAALGPILGGLLLSEGWPLARVTPVMACGCLIAAMALLLLATPRRGGAEPNPRA
jgi:benzoate transport